MLENKKLETKKTIDQSLKIVAIGASSGGLDAMTELLENLTATTGMVFIYISHLIPDQKSLLTVILAKVTKMKVQEVTNKILMKANNVYVIPPGKQMTLLDGHLQLTPRVKKPVTHLPINIFFSSLASVYKHNAVGVVLSGNATDGTKGLMAIKAAGGTTFAQDDSAKYSSMPQSAIATNDVDFILSPALIAKQLIKLSDQKNSSKKNIEPIQNEIEKTNPFLKSIFNLLYNYAQVDFSYYKMPTIKRRIARQMQLKNVNSLETYAKYLTDHKEEVAELYKDLLINVTEFFRNPDAHQYLKNTLFPKLLKQKTELDKLRIWVPACATGEEAYSIAITLLDIQEEHHSNISFLIFATDLSATAITKARKGEYTKKELINVPQKQLQHYYTKKGDKYTIGKAIKDICVFATHNLLKDPPFSKMDFISCCNLFIYLNETAQKHALTTFHYALNEDGYLMLGKSESIGRSLLFSQINLPYKIFTRKKTTGLSLLPTLIPKGHQPIVQHTSVKSNLIIKKAQHLNTNLENEIDTILLEKFTPIGVLINHALEIIQFRGTTEPFLKHVTGKATLNILKMAAPEIAFELRHNIPIAIKKGGVTHKKEIELNNLLPYKSIDLTIIALTAEIDEPLLLILFTNIKMVDTYLQIGNSSKQKETVKAKKIQRLEAELLQVRKDVLIYAQQQETYIEELQSSNQEVVSSNEELQSLNEELETTKEEIESTNEELTTTNQELLTRNELLKETYDYAEAIIATLQEPFLILDKHLKIISANQSFYKKFLYTPTETEGVSLFEMGNNDWNTTSVRKLLIEILPKKKQFNNFEIVHNFNKLGKKTMRLSAKILYQKTQKEKLILLSIEDYTERKKSIDLLLQSEQKFEAAVYAVQGIVWTNNAAGEMVGIQKGWANLTGQKHEEYKGYGWSSAIHPDDIQPTILAWQNSVKNKTPFVVEHRVKLKNGKWGHFLVKAAPLFNEDGTLREWVGVHTNITKQKEDEQQLLNLTKELEGKVYTRTKELEIVNQSLQHSNETLLLLNKELNSFGYIASHDLQEPLRKIQSLTNRIIDGKENLSAKGNENLERIKNAAYRMQTLIKDLLNYATLENSKNKKEKTDLNIIVEEVKLQLSELINEKKAIITVKPLCNIVAIPQQITQVMLNLISNALKFSVPNTPPHITINSKTVKYNKTTHAGLQKLNEYCCITVKDKGIGFEPQYSKKIFDVFQHLNDKQDYAGTGIGLAIVKKIIENHDGIVTAKSTLGKGSTFEMYIPI